MRAGATTRALFIGMAGLAVVYLLLSSEWVWAGYLEPPQSEEAKEAKEGDGAPRPSNVPFIIMKNVNEVAAMAPVETHPKGDDKGEGGGVGASDWPAAAGGAAAPAAAAAPQFGPLLDCSGLPFGVQLRSAPFIALGVWSIFTIYRTMFVLGSITEQMVANGGGGGRSVGHSESLVRVFNGLILISFILTVPFGRFVDRCGMPASFTLVNTLGMFCFGILLARPDWALYLGFLAFGCFRAWQGRTPNPRFLSYTASYDVGSNICLGTSKCCSPRRPMHFKVSLFELNGIRDVASSIRQALARGTTRSSRRTSKACSAGKASGGCTASASGASPWWARRCSTRPWPSPWAAKASREMGTSWV